MKKILLLTLIICAFDPSARAGFSLLINNPQFQWQGQTQGYITEPTAVITPKGVYAQVEFTFRIHCQNNYGPNDTLESVLEFDLPANALVHNSWLWLDDNTIIQAAIIDRGRAVQIYESIVKRRRDPSLLVQTGSNSYRLNVFPLTISYPRKVKIVYSVPMNMLSDRGNIPLPVDILNASLIKPSLTVVVKSNSSFTQPFFTEQPYNNFVIATSGSDQVLQIPSTAYENDLTLNYRTNLPGGVYLNTYPTDNNSGIYQLMVNPGNVVGQDMPRSVVLVLDHQNSSSGSIYAFAKLKNILRSYLLNHFSNIDSFNIFYVNSSNSVQQSFTTWAGVDSTGVALAFNGIPAVINSNSASKYEELIKEAMLFCKSKPGNSAQVVLVSNSSQITSQALADTTFNRINAYVGGFANRLHVINNSSYSQWINGNQLLANELLYSKLTLATGGNYYKHSGYVYVAPNYIYNLDVKNSLKQIAQQLGTSISSYYISLPVTGGFVYSRYDVNRLNRFSTSVPYVETGKYFGSLQAGTVTVNLLTPIGVTTGQLTVTNTDPALSHSRQAWSYHYINDLFSLNNNNVYTTEIIDSSMSNRVLCSYTAFLALENGDTVKSSANEHGPGNGGGPGLDVEELARRTVRCYPNPFTSELTIEFIKPVEEILILDITGRVVLRLKTSPGDKKFVWNGRNSAGAELPSGIYIIKAKTEDGTATLKVVKR